MMVYPYDHSVERAIFDIALTARNHVTASHESYLRGHMVQRCPAICVELHDQLIALMNVPKQPHFSQAIVDYTFRLDNKNLIESFAVREEENSNAFFYFTHSFLFEHIDTIADGETTYPASAENLLKAKTDLEALLKQERFTHPVMRDPIKQLCAFLASKYATTHHYEVATDSQEDSVRFTGRVLNSHQAFHVYTRSLAGTMQQVHGVSSTDSTDNTINAIANSVEDNVSV